MSASVPAHAKPLQLVLLLGGEGMRFSNEGYLRPKVLVRLHGKPMVYWTLKTLDVKEHDSVLILYHKRLDDWQFAPLVKHYFPKMNLTFVPLQFSTRGATESALVASHHIKERDLPLVFLDGDNIHTNNILSTLREFYYPNDGKDRRTSCHALFYQNVKDPSPVFSFVKLKDSDDVPNAHPISAIVEKKVISHSICIGVYSFNSTVDFQQYACKVLDEAYAVKGEYYMSCVFGSMLNNQVPVYGLEATEFVSVGTPLQVNQYLMSVLDPNQAPRSFSCEPPTSVKGLRVCFDLDNTLVSYPEVAGDYTTVKPIEATIELAKELSAGGAIIIIHTARRMKTHSNNVGKVVMDQGRITLDTIEKYGIPCDELVFGKPLADMYIDDCAVNPYVHLLEETGMPDKQKFTQSISHAVNTKEQSYIAVPARSHHRVEFLKDRVRKIGHTTSMKAQAYYYEHIPQALKIYFPEVLSTDEQNDTMTMEMQRINGPPMSYCYVNGTLTVGQLKETLESLREFHAYKVQGEPYDIDNTMLYSNWGPKLQSRWTSRRNDTYVNFRNAELVVPRLIHWLLQYQKGEYGIKSAIIHGDAVFTNAIIKADRPRIAWVDMRGMLGNKCTLGGDANYDWSKVLQSLLGYDFVLLGLPNQAQTAYAHLLEFYRTTYVSWHGETLWAWLWILCAQSMVSILPLHEDQPKESQQFYRMGVRWLIQAEEMLAKQGIVYSGPGQQVITYEEIFGSE